MSDNEQNATNPVDSQGTSETEESDEQRAAALRRRVEEGKVSSAPAPVDDEIIIK
jgi:hypothetical protein